MPLRLGGVLADCVAVVQSLRVLCDRNHPRKLNRRAYSNAIRCLVLWRRQCVSGMPASWATAYANPLLLPAASAAGGVPPLPRTAAEQRGRLLLLSWT